MKKSRRYKVNFRKLFTSIACLVFIAFAIWGIVSYVEVLNHVDAGMLNEDHTYSSWNMFKVLFGCN